MNTEMGGVAVEVSPAPEDTRIDVDELDKGSVRVSVRSESVTAAVFLTPEEAQELGESLLANGEEVDGG